MKKEKEKDLGDELYDLMRKHNIPMRDAGEMIDTVMKSIAKPIEHALKAELDAHLGYDKHEVSESENSRNGYSKKKVIGTFGEAVIDIPRDRNASFEPILVKKNQRTITKIEEHIILLYSRGTSTRDISSIVQELYGLDLDATYISKITDQILPDIQEFHSRRLSRIYPIVFVDGIRFSTREDGTAKEVTVYIVLGINTFGIKEVIGFYIGESETSKYWLTVFTDMKNRGVEQVLIMASDNLPGISEAMKSAFPNTVIQKCVVHQIRNSVRFVKYTDLKEFTKDMKAIYQAPNLKAAEIALEEFEKKWSSNYGYATKSWRKNFEELVAFFQFPPEIRQLIYTTNPIENLNRQIRKNTKNKTSFPNNKALEKMVFLALKEATKKWSGSVTRNWGMVMNQLQILFNIEF